MLFEFVKEMPKPETTLRVDFASLLGPLFFTWVISQLFPVSQYVLFNRNGTCSIDKSLFYYSTFWRSVFLKFLQCVFSLLSYLVRFYLINLWHSNRIYYQPIYRCYLFIYHMILFNSLCSSYLLHDLLSAGCFDSSSLWEGAETKNHDENAWTCGCSLLDDFLCLFFGRIYYIHVLFCAFRLISR